MTRLIRPLLLLVASLLVVLAWGAPDLLAHSPAVLPDLLTMAMLPVMIRNQSDQELYRASNPGSQTGPEALPWCLYDTQTFPAAGIARLRFFNQTNADRTLTNMETGGQLSDPQFFEIWNLMMDFQLAGPTINAAAAGQANDLDLLLKTQRATFTLNISNKNYGPFPATLLHATGGGVGNVFGTTAAAGSIQYVNNGVQDGGWSWGGAVIIPPKVGWFIDLEFAGIQAISAETNIRIALNGVLHRRVL